MTDEVLFRREGVAGIVSLNRPKAIHALTLDMCEAMIAQLAAWVDDDAVKVVLIEHAEGRGFCSGGDINLLRQSALTDGGAAGRRFFHEEYRLNHQLFTYPKPIVAFMDGITMGGGVGISQPARFRVATENTRYAMPETGIGLFPDVGGGWYLSRLDGRVGRFLALTGARFDGAECLWAGLATHYLPSEALAEAKSRIAAGHEAGGVLAALATKAPEPRIAAQAGAIRRHFAFDTLEQVLASLESDDGEWAAKELATLRTKSPQACKVSLRQLEESLALETFAQNMAMEYRIGSRVLVLPDFAEGVRAVIVDKDQNPKWSPAAPEGVTEDMLDAIFAPLSPEEEWKPL
ncbi:enoyl-CoA hydratase/isomerase family protein [Novosphingobium soli]|uniref:3-hydroxyisobutyryl-CoA hydrolase n=1 Tax=Novosphingobium soli TaxID=574956 RepID=A0ABV6CUN9_9SPHN